MNALKRYEKAMIRKARSKEGKTLCYWCGEIATAKWNSHDYCYACLQRAYQREDGEAKGKPVSCQCPKCERGRATTIGETPETSDIPAQNDVIISEDIVPLADIVNSVVSENQPSFPPIRRRGRPKGSKNNPKSHSGSLA